MLLLIGYGNKGRGDDGLGPEFAQRISEENFDGLTIDTDYQLSVDHAAAVAEARLVVFADAQMNSNEPYQFEHVFEGNAESLSSPVAVLTLARTLFGATPQAFVLGITGYEFGEVSEGLSAGALHNLELAAAFFRDWFEVHPYRAAPAPV